MENQEQLKNQNFTNFVTNMKLKNAFLLLGFAYKAKRWFFIHGFLTKIVDLFLGNQRVEVKTE